MPTNDVDVRQRGKSRGESYALTRHTLHIGRHISNIINHQNFTTMATKIERTNETKNFVINAKVTGVDLVPEDNTRLRLAFDTTFETYNMSTGELQETNTFSKKIMALLQQLVALQVPQARLLLGMCMGHNPNPQILCMLLLNATLEVEFVFKAKGEKRENTNDVYNNDTFVPTIRRISLAMDELFTNTVNSLILTKPVLEVKAAVNPFAI